MIAFQNDFDESGAAALPLLLVDWSILRDFGQNVNKKNGQLVMPCEWVI